MLIVKSYFCPETVTGGYDSTDKLGKPIYFRIYGYTTLLNLVHSFNIFYVEIICFL